MVVPKKVPGKWRICVDFRELNKATLKDYFPLPFIDQVLDTLQGNNTSPFLMVIAATIKFKLLLKIRIRPPLPAHGVPMPIEFCPLACVMPLLLFRGQF